MEKIEFPRAWKNKTSGTIVKAMPWWECPEENEILDQETISRGVKFGQIENDPWPERMYKIGALIQIGWMLENAETKVWFGVSPNTKDHFEDLGAWSDYQSRSARASDKEANKPDPLAGEGVAEGPVSRD